MNLRNIFLRYLPFIFLLISTQFKNNLTIENHCFESTTNSLMPTTPTFYLSYDTTPKPKKKRPKIPTCDENEIMLQLARLYVISPERIILLLTMDSIEDTCRSISEVIDEINYIISKCPPFPSNNLYIKLFDGLRQLHEFACVANKNSKNINHIHDCLVELREDLIECEGPPDWFEESNKTYVCQYFNRIINCDYLKTATLCGLASARILRIMSADIISKVILCKCEISQCLPRVEHPMACSVRRLYLGGEEFLIYLFILFLQKLLI